MRYPSNSPFKGSLVSCSGVGGTLYVCWLNEKDSNVLLLHCESKAVKLTEVS